MNQRGFFLNDRALFADPSGGSNLFRVVQERFAASLEVSGFRRATGSQIYPKLVSIKESALRATPRDAYVWTVVERSDLDTGAPQTPLQPPVPRPGGLRICAERTKPWLLWRRGCSWKTRAGEGGSSTFLNRRSAMGSCRPTLPFSKTLQGSRVRSFERSLAKNRCRK